MQIKSRIKYLEKKLLGNQEYWAIFSIGYYSDSNEEQAAKQRLLNEYLDNGNPIPTHNVFCNEIPGSTMYKQEESFLSSFAC
jgi:hypothetical protein